MDNYAMEHVENLYYSLCLESRYARNSHIQRSTNK